MNAFDKIIWLEIHKNLNLSDGAKIARLNKASNAAFKGNLNYKCRLQNDLPNYYINLADKIKNNDPVNYYQRYKAATQWDYINLSSRQKKLFQCVKRDDLAAIKKLYFSLDNLLDEDQNGVSVIAWARRLGHQDILRYFLEIARRSYLYGGVGWGASRKKKIISAKSNGEYKERELRMLDWLIMCGITGEALQVQFGRNFRLNHYIVSAYANEMQIAAINSHKPKVLETYGSRQLALLKHAIRYNNKAYVSYCLEVKPQLLKYECGLGYNLNYWYNDKFNPLHMAVSFGHTEIVKRLLESDINTTEFTREENPRQAIHIASRHGNSQIVKLLLAKNPELLNAMDNAGHTPVASTHETVKPKLPSIVKDNTNENIIFASLIGTVAVTMLAEIGLIMSKSTMFSILLFAQMVLGIPVTTSLLIISFGFIIVPAMITLIISIALGVKGKRLANPILRHI